MTPLAVLPAMGVLTFLSALRPFIFASRTRIVALNLIAATSFMIALLLFPDDIATAFDRAIGVPGLGYVISRVTISLLSSSWGPPPTRQTYGIRRTSSF